MRKRAAELCSDVRVLRRLADDAPSLGWQHILEWAPLTDSEKSWRTAHHAATTGDLDALRESVAKLPSAGYPNRASLLLPHLGAVHHQPEAWKPALDAIAQLRQGTLDLLVGTLAPNRAASDLNEKILSEDPVVLVSGVQHPLKERRRLVLMVRETPFNLAHLRNMTAVTEMGGIVYPPLPAFYLRPGSIDELVNESVERVLALLQLQGAAPRAWDGL